MEFFKDDGAKTADDLKSCQEITIDKIAVQNLTSSFVIKSTTILLAIGFTFDQMFHSEFRNGMMWGV